ncbi:rRNA adenine N-6-methyltransferase family protein [uncultured Dokdonia sp.]|uniref:THUMP-like domain-containing protein n=1 Tax=uncultured Dokdonia sp. TaxID=575653 RepID=UPI00262BEC83|nr:rRNA adenine N-6-methyltransferase family protein [uncultured Dokdonia sp.]
MNVALLRSDVQEYLAAHAHTPIAQFILKGSPFQDITPQELAQQLDGKRRVKNKLPLWHATEGILFPPKINLEQTSSERTAKYKASLLKSDTIIDITGGLGIDTYYFSKVASKVTHVEMNASLSAFAKANLDTLAVSNVTHIIGNAIDFLANSAVKYDTMYVDPGRRTDAKGKVFMLKDCLPNVPEHIDLLLSKCTSLWIKTAPLLDITAGLKELKNVSEIHIIAVKNEVKELLWRIDQEVKDNCIIHTANIIGNTIDQTSFSYEEVFTAEANYNLPKNYLYEPNSALLKSGGFNWISKQYQVDKLHIHTQLYTCNTPIPFPGRSFKIERILPYNKQLKKELTIPKAHITTRNFKETVIDLRKKFKIKDGGDIYLFFTTQVDDKKVVLVCRKL